MKRGLCHTISSERLIFTTSQFANVRFPKKRHAILGAVVILAAIVGVFAVQLFTQTFPSITRPNPPPQSLQVNCQTLVADNSTIPAVGNAGYVLFNCGPSTAAFKMLHNATVTPTFTLPTGYTSLSATTNNCNGSLLGLQSGTSIILALGNYSYCALTDTTTATIATFTVTWASGLKDNTSMALTCPGTLLQGGGGVCSIKITDLANSTLIPTGTVTFNSSNTSTGTVGASCVLSSSGTCSIGVHALAGCNDFIVLATYVGDAAHNGSMASQDIFVNRITPICP